MIVVDIGVPRNVDPAVRLLAELRVIDMQDIERSLSASLDLRRREIPAVERIVEEETEDYLTRLARPDVQPILRQIWQRTETIRQAELARLRKSAPDLSPEREAQIDAWSRALVSRLLEGPSQRLRQSADVGDADGLARVARELFEAQDH